MQRNGRRNERRQSTERAESTPMKFNYTVSILSKTIDRLNGQIAVQGAKETELLADELFIREDIENMQRQIRELQSAIIKLETDNQ